MLVFILFILKKIVFILFIDDVIILIFSILAQLIANLS